MGFFGLNLWVKEILFFGVLAYPRQNVLVGLRLQFLKAFFTCQRCLALKLRFIGFVMLNQSRPEICTPILEVIFSGVMLCVCDAHVVEPLGAKLLESIVELDSNLVKLLIRCVT